MPRATRRAPDPARAANERVLADRQARIDEKMKEIPDLGLKLKAEEPKSAADLFAGNGLDEFDKKAFGNAAQTTVRWVYGPDPLVDTCPEMMALIQREGLDATADIFRRTILLKEHEAAADEVLRRGIFYGIKKFGKQKVAEAFAHRILSIPARQVEYETGPEEFGDPLLMGGNVLREVVNRYGNEPGMSYRFLSERCVAVLGMRGYVFVKDENGQVAKAGTLMLAKIPMAIAAGRSRHYRDQSMQLVKDAEEEYLAKTEQVLREAGRVAAGSRPLRSSEVVHGNASEREELVGADLAMGVSFERQQS
jgi:hypothetical protein